MNKKRISMNIETQKLELIDWILKLKDSSAINKIKKMKDTTQEKKRKGIRKFGCGKNIFTYISEDGSFPTKIVANTGVFPVFWMIFSTLCFNFLSISFDNDLPSNKIGSLFFIPVYYHLFSFCFCIVCQHYAQRLAV